MSISVLSVRELLEKDIDTLTQYWLDAEPSFLQGLGVDLSKVPDKKQWKKMLKEQIGQPYTEKQSYCLVWTADGNPVGHSNINKIIFGQEAYMHLHLWNAENRKRGWGTTLVKITLPYFFEHYKLQKLFCEPYALNPAPHKTMEKLGFELVDEYTATPGWINFEQPVRLWMLSRERFFEISGR